MRALLLLLVMALFAPAKADGFVTKASFEDGPLQVTMLNWEQPRGKPFLIVHFEIRNPTDQQARCDWMALSHLERLDGTSMTSNYDVLVDSGTGMTRATGPFMVAQRRKATASVLYILKQGDLPGHLVLPDGRRSARIEMRGKVRWTQ